MDEIGDEFNEISGNDKTGEELQELTNESDELNEIDDASSEKFGETDELNEFDDDISDVFSEPDEFDDDIPDVFSEPDEFDDDIPDVFSEPDEFDDDIPETFSEPDEFDDDIPEVFGESDEIDDNLDDTIHDKEVGERAEEDQDSDDVGNVVENENIGPQSTSTVLTSEMEELESEMEHQEQEEEIEIRPEEYQEDTEPIVNTDESEFIKDVEELAEHAREIKAEDESVEPQAEKENAAYYAEQYYEKLKEKEALNDQNSKEEQETEELMQEVAEKLKGDKESGYKSDELEKEDLTEESKEITSTEEFEYLWEVRDKLDREGKLLEEIEEVMHEAEEMYETLKNAEKLYEEQELEKLKLVDHEGEATEEDLKEDLDRIDLVEKAVEIEQEMVQQGKSQEEIDARVEESIETAEFEEKLEKIIEAQELEKLKLVDHEDEATEEDLKEVLDRVDLVEKAIELEERLVQQGESQEEIDVRVEESIETAEFEEKLEKIIEELELEKLKLVDHEDEEDIDDAREEIDRPAEAEYLMEVEEELHRQGMSQEEIDEQMEDIASNYQKEINKKQEKEEEDLNASEELEKYDLETNEQNSSAEQYDQIELTSALSSEKKEESEKEENERLQELYRRETGRRPIYARQKSKGYSQWLEQRELRSEKIKNSKSESEKKKEIDEEDWKAILNQWIKEASKEERNAEFISELKKALDSYNEFEDLTRKYLELYEKAQNEKLSEKENNRLKSLLGRLHERDPIQFELLLSVFFIKKYITEQYWDDFWNKPLVNRLLSKFFKHISQKILKLKKAQENKENLEVLKLELDAIEIESEDKKDFLEEITKLGSEESDEEDWKTTLKQWIKEASEEECNAELKSELKKALDSYNEFEYLTRKFLELYEKAQHEKLSEKEKNRLKSLTDRLHELGPIQLELLANIRAFKDYFYNHLWELLNSFFVNRVRGKFFKHISQKYKELRKEQKNEIIKYLINKNRLKKSFLESEDFIYVDQDINLKERQISMTQNQNKTKKDLHKRIFRYGESLHQGIVGIYYICEIFPKKFRIKKTFFSGNELNYILDKQSQFFYTINKNLKDKDLIRYYGTVTRKKKSNEKIYIITEKGIKFTEEIIEIKRRDFPILFGELISTLEKRYIDYIVDLINSENKIIIRSQKDINDKLRKMVGDNNIELVTSYRSDHLDIKFHCKKCKKQFKDTYQLIESRKDPKLFCPYCFPELKTNIYLSEELKVQISKFVFNELRKTTIHKLSKNKILDIVEYIKKLVFNFVEPQIIEKKSEFKEFIEKYICSIVGFLTEVKRLYETNQFINLSEISLLFHDKSIVSESMWQGVCRTIIKYLREEFDFNIRTKRYDSLPESTRKSIRNYRNLYRLIQGVDRSGNIITYLDIDFKTEIKIYYDGKCQGINGYCPFNIDYKFLPALSFDHRLENYNAIVKRKEMRYISPTKMLGGSFNGALAKMKSQIGGMDLRCRNCHSYRHHKMYHFLPIFNFLKSLHIKDIDVITTYVLDSVNLLAKKYFDHTKKDIKLSKKYTQAQVLGRIRNQIFRLIKKKYIVEYLFGANYICPVCQKANINDHLTCFEAHHTNETLFENGLQKIIFSLYYFKSIKWSIKNLITQECIYVCRNCHTMITTINYNKNALVILENEIDALYINTFYDNLYKKVHEKRDIIIDWKSRLKNNMNTIPNPFLKMFDYGESIYSALICIYYICEIFSQTTKKDFFTAEELNYIQKKSSSYFKQYKNNLIDLEYIQYEKRLLQYRGFGFNKDIYKITFEGILKAKEIIEERLEEFPDEFNELVSQWEHRNKKYNARKQRLSAFDIVLICVYFICDKEKIEFFLNAFHYIIDKENSYFGKHRKKLLNLEYITENQETANSFKEINITPKGIKKAGELISLITRDYFEKYQKLISDWEKRYNEYLKTIENENKDPNYMHI